MAIETTTKRSFDEDLSDQEKGFSEDAIDSTQQDASESVTEQSAEKCDDNNMDQSEDDHEYPGIWSLLTVLIALYFAIFLVALVRYPSLSLSLSHI